MWEGGLSYDRFLLLTRGLLTEPYSRYRDRYFVDNPPEESSSTVPSWIGWNPELQYLVLLINLLVSRFTPKRRLSKDALLKTPMDRRQQHHPRTMSEFMAEYKQMRNRHH